jgi:hypothetical protein
MIVSLRVLGAPDSWAPGLTLGIAALAAAKDASQLGGLGEAPLVFFFSFRVLCYKVFVVAE